MNEDGYREVYLPFHGAAHHGWVLEHRLIMEMKLGARLPGDIHVHHRDGNPSNNADENLLMCPARELHESIHFAMNANDTERVESAESMCREFERGVKILLEQMRSRSFDPAEALGVGRVDKDSAADFLRGLSAENQQAVASILGRLPKAPTAGRKAAMEAAFARESLPLGNEERSLVQMLSKKGAPWSVIGALTQRSPTSIEKIITTPWLK